MIISGGNTVTGTTTTLITSMTSVGPTRDSARDTINDMTETGDKKQTFTCNTLYMYTIVKSSVAAVGNVNLHVIILIVLVV